MNIYRKRIKKRLIFPYPVINSTPLTPQSTLNYYLFKSNIIKALLCVRPHCTGSLGFLFLASMEHFYLNMGHDNLWQVVLEEDVT